ncbi:flagellar biosynthesis protein FlgH [Arcobacter sp. CECT 8983]|uniref:flagellar basal body L-ring protein FlgH n=1 Tax=Arcobacter sp. CECT 8983 TaxID=2044508 RepID=UPI00100A9E6B|nr:flagellar basal body L-ring protein FlgH [Arcobacter sp. CECT 8983]RXJ91133.1 flagellar biosynthesis protein FlgH [Arcobacter sp. CECT 8983]
MKLSKYLLLTILPFLLAGCVEQPEIKFEKPALQIPKKEPVVQKKKGSLYSMRGPSLFADKKDLQIGDIIQVKISESLNSKTNTKREISSDRNSNLGGGLVSQMDANIPLSSTVQKAADKFNSYAGVNFGTKSKSENTGEVKTNLSETFTTSVSAIIEETYQNGNYLIRAQKEMLIDGQKQSLVLTGVIRPYDITPENSVTSSQVANLKILYIKDGEEQDVMRTPWATRILQTFWPF